MYVSMTTRASLSEDVDTWLQVGSPNDVQGILHPKKFFGFKTAS